VARQQEDQQEGAGSRKKLYEPTVATTVHPRCNGALIEKGRH